MTFMLDSASAPDWAAADSARASGNIVAWAGYGTPSANWREVNDWTKAPSGEGFPAVQRAGLIAVLIHFGPDAEQAIAQARELGITYIACDVEAGDAGTYAPAFGDEVRASLLHAIVYGTVATVSRVGPGHFDSFWLAEPGWNGTPGPDYGVQNSSFSFGPVGHEIQVDQTVIGDNFLIAGRAPVKLNKPIVAVVETPTGHGYYQVAADGGVFTFGDAVLEPPADPLPSENLNAPIVAAAGTPSGHGLILVAADGGVFPLGDAVGYGAIP